MINKWLISVTKLLYASDIFYLIATFSSRTAVICLLYALSPERLNKLVTKSGIIASLLMTVAAVLMVALGCNPVSPWTQLSQECTSVVCHDGSIRCSKITDTETAVQVLGSRRCAQHLAGAVHHRRRFENALYAATSLDRQSQSHYRFRIETPVSRIFDRTDISAKLTSLHSGSWS